MKKILSILFTLFVSAALVAQTDFYRINIGDFSSLTVIDGVGVDYYCMPDSAGWVVFYASPEMSSHINFSNKKGHLSIQSDADEKPIEGLPRVTVYSSELVKVENSGDSLLHVHSTVPVESFKAKQIGNGSIVVDTVDSKTMDLGITAGRGSLTLRGKADKASISNVSTGPIDASRLTVSNVKATVFGPGGVHVTPTQQLTIYGAGSGVIYYRTKPAKVSNRSIGVKTAIEPTD